MKKFTRAAGVILTASLMTAGALSTASAAATPDVADRLDQIAQVVDPVPVESSPVSAVRGGAVLLGDAGSKQVRLDLPATSKPTKDDGRYLLDGAKGASIAVAPTKDGAQVLVGVESSKAPTTFAFDIDAPAGFAPVLSPDGSAAVVDADGRAAAQIEAPWAFDATGKRVPTHFRVSGDRLTQVVDHRAGDYAYPIVADPKVKLCSWGVAVCIKLSKKETLSAHRITQSSTARDAAQGLCALFGFAGSGGIVPGAVCVLVVRKQIRNLRATFSSAVRARRCAELKLQFIGPLWIRSKVVKC